MKTIKNSLARDYILLLLGFLFTGCSITGKVPTASSDPVELPALPVSNIALPVSMNLQPVEDQANASVPSVVHNSRWPGEDFAPLGFLWLDACYRFEVTRDPVVVNGLGGNIFSIGTVARYKVWGSVPCSIVGVSCGAGGESLRKIQVGFHTVLNFNSNYSLSGTTKLVDLNALDPCKVTLFSIDVTGKAVDAFRGALNNVSSQIDGAIQSNSNFTSQAQQAWNEIQKDIKLADGVFLRTNAQKFQAGGITSTGKSATVQIGLIATPEIVTRENSNPNLTPLPPLDTNPQGGGFNIYWDTKSDYNFISALLKKEMVGKTYFMPKDPKIYMKVADIEIYGLGDRFITIKVVGSGKLKFKKYKKITFYLIGTPFFDPATSELSIPDANYVVDVENDPLIKVGLDLFKLPIKESLQESKFSLKKEIEKAKELLNQAINKDVTDKIALSGTVNNFSGLFLFPKAKEIVFRSNLSGNLAVIIK